MYKNSKRHGGIVFTYFHMFCTIRPLCACVLTPKLQKKSKRNVKMLPQRASSEQPPNCKNQIGALVFCGPTPRRQRWRFLAAPVGMAQWGIGCTFRMCAAVDPPESFPTETLSTTNPTTTTHKHTLASTRTNEHTLR